MTLYFLEWDNGEKWSDHDVELLGVFTSPELREDARKRLYPKKAAEDGGFMVMTDIEADKEL